MIAKFKKERMSLKSRIVKLESRMNSMTHDPALDVKPTKAGAKSVANDWLAPEKPERENFDSKSEKAGAAKSVGAPTQSK